MARRPYPSMTFASARQPEGSTPPTALAPDTTPIAPDPQAIAFQAWLSDFQIRAIAAGWPAELVTQQMFTLTARQPEFVKSTGDYVKASVTEARIQTGRRKRAEVTQFPEIEARFG